MKTLRISFLFPTVHAAETVPTGLPQQIGNFYQWALGIGGLVALGVLIFGGILYTVSAGNASRQDDAKQWITGSLVGLIILFGSWFILNTINPNLTKLKDLSLIVNEAGGGGIPPGTGDDFEPPPGCPFAIKPSYSNDFCLPRGNETRFAAVCQANGCGIPNCHGAIDLFVPYGTPVYAVADGAIGNSWGLAGAGGYRLHLITDSGVDYYYAHLVSNPVVPRGASVKVGDLLGYADATGSAQGTSNHLHFEIHPTGDDNYVINPYNTIQQNCSTL